MLYIVNRRVGNSNNHYLAFNEHDPAGPNKPEWQAYVGIYAVVWEAESDSAAGVTIENGYLYFRDGKAEAIKPGLFFLYAGKVIDFRSSPPTFAAQEIRKRKR